MKIESAPLQATFSSPIQASNIAGSYPSHLQASSLQSIREGRDPFISFGEAFAQLLETVALFACLPFFIYTFFLASISLVFLPLFIILFPLIIVGEVFREILYTFLPWIFPHPHHRW